MAFGDAKDWEDRIQPQERAFEIDGVDDVYRQAIAAAYAADPASYYYDPDDRLRHVLTLEKLAKQYPLRPEIRELLARTKAGSSWSTFLQFDSRAGIYSMARHGWQRLEWNRAWRPTGA